MMITHEWAQTFAAQWASQWNAHDIDAVLSHYADDFEMSSPFISRFTGDSTGILRGKEAVGIYWRAALERVPDLHFHVRNIFVGANSVTIHYDAVLGHQAAETFFFNEEGKVFRASAAYNALS